MVAVCTRRSTGILGCGHSGASKAHRSYAYLAEPLVIEPLVQLGHAERGGLRVHWVDDHVDSLRTITDGTSATSDLAARAQSVPQANRHAAGGLGVPTDAGGGVERAARAPVVRRNSNLYELAVQWPRRAALPVHDGLQACQRATPRCRPLACSLRLQRPPVSSLPCRTGRGPRTRGCRHTDAPNHNTRAQA